MTRRRQGAFPARSGAATTSALSWPLAAAVEDGAGRRPRRHAHHAAADARRRGLVVVVSDFLVPDGWENPLRALASRHDVVAVEVIDPASWTSPTSARWRWPTPRPGRRIIDTGDATLRGPLRRSRRGPAGGRGRRIAAAGAHHLVLRTDRDWVVDLVRFVGARRRNRYNAAAAARTGVELMLALSFLQPSRLWLLVAARRLLAAYVVSQLRRRGYVVRFTTMDLLDSVAPKRPRWRRHLPAVGLLLGLVALSLSLAKPAVASQVADERAVVVLAMDTSLSMEAADVAPSPGRRAGGGTGLRRERAEGVRVGLVGFDNGARLLVPPTDKMAVIERAVDRLALARGRPSARPSSPRSTPSPRRSRRTPGEGRTPPADGPPRTARSRPSSCCCRTGRTRSGARTTKPRRLPRPRAGRLHRRRRHRQRSRSPCPTAAPSPCRSTARPWPTWPTRPGPDRSPPTARTSCARSTRTSAAR